LNIDGYIAELLEDHDCVIVPDFGGFVANYASASINAISHRFDPPFRKISFNKLLVHNDGLLAAYIAQKETESYDQAIEALKNYTVFLKNEISKEGKVSLENVGVLHKLADGTFRFEQIKNPILFKDGFGLESFFAKPVQVAKVLPEEVPVKEKPALVPIPPAPVKEEVAEVETSAEPKVIPIQTETETENAEKKRTRYWPVAAAVLALPLIGYALWVSLSTPLLTDRSQFHYSDLNPFADKVCAEYEARNLPFAATEHAESDEVIVIEKPEFIEITRSNDPDKTLVAHRVDPVSKLKSIGASKELKYHVVGGCFSMESNASGLVNLYRSRGTNASIIDQKGELYRVSVESFATKKEAKQALTSYKNAIPGAWVLYK